MKAKVDDLRVQLGGHCLQISVGSNEIAQFVRNCFTLCGKSEDPQKPHDLLVHIEDGYGEPFVDFSVDIKKTADKVTYQRTDYLIEADAAYKEARVYVHDCFALKHALMNLYSAFIVFHHWGLLVHSSCVLHQGEAHVFAGRSGAGKSTVASLSTPRRIVSDEATIVRIRDVGVTVFDSPFRSDSTPHFDNQAFPVKSVNFLKQSDSVHRERISSSRAMQDIIDKVFYWPADKKDTMKVLHLIRTLVQHVSVFELQFQKNATFWEMIS